MAELSISSRKFKKIGRARGNSGNKGTSAYNLDYRLEFRIRIKPIKDECDSGAGGRKQGLKSRRRLHFAVIRFQSKYFFQNILFFDPFRPGKRTKRWKKGFGLPIQATIELKGHYIAAQGQLRRRRDGIMRRGC